MNDDQIKYMVDRFLGWRLPENFTPDAGISFARTFNEHTPYPMKHEPVGTNLFDASQADQMVRYMVEGMPAPVEAGRPVQNAAREALEQFVNITPIVMQDFPDAHKVTFDVDSQHFDIAPHGCETKEDAEWMRDMFLRALIKAVGHLSPAVPEGWKLVPIEPTSEMMAAVNCRGMAQLDAVGQAWRQGYQEMVAAAPRHQVAEDDK